LARVCGHFPITRRSISDQLASITFPITFSGEFARHAMGRGIP